MRAFSALCLSALLVFSLGLRRDGKNTPRDYRIRVVTMPDGHTVAVPPTCPEWSKTQMETLSNKAWDQYGCISASNLAAQVENPNDLLAPAPMGDANATTTATSQNLYETGKTKALKSLSESTSQ